MTLLSIILTFVLLLSLSIDSKSTILACFFLSFRKALKKGQKGPDWQLLKCVGLLTLALVLGVISVMNISLAFFIAVMWVPVMVIVQPTKSRYVIKFEFRIKAARNLVQLSHLNKLYFLVVLYVYTCMYLYIYIYIFIYIYYLYIHTHTHTHTFDLFMKIFFIL